MAVQSFSNFTNDNDPHGEHDFGASRSKANTYFSRSITTTSTAARLGRSRRPGEDDARAHHHARRRVLILTTERRWRWPTQAAYSAYTVIKREGQDDFWLAIGAAFMHQDGDGYNIVLQALPIDGKIVLRLPKDDQTDSAEAQQQPCAPRTTGAKVHRK